MMTQVFDEELMRQEICEVGCRIWQREYVAGNDGNLSVRLSENEILATPTDVSKGHLTPDMLCVIDREGKLLRGHMKPSSELKMHTALYNARPDVRGVCHAHPVTATGSPVGRFKPRQGHVAGSSDSPGLGAADEIRHARH
jgi:L-fuculose-phosphate aldolase